MFAVTGLIAASASSGKLPAEGTWLYDAASTTGKVATFQAYVSVAPEKSEIYTLRGALIGTCKKNGVRRSGSFVDFNVRSSFVVDPDGRFKATRRSSGGIKGTAKVKGVIDGKLIKGTITARQRGTAFGNCKGRGKFRAKGELIG